MTEATPYRLRLTDRVELCDSGGQPVPLRTRKVALLLAMLVVEGVWRRRDELAKALWEDAEPEAAGVRLRNALSALRKALGPKAIRTSGDSVALDPTCVVVEDGPGEFMPGFDEEWAIERRLRLRAQSVAQALDEARAAESEGRSDVALAHVARACAIDPLDSEAARLRSKLLAKTGRRAQASEAGLAHRVRVVRELGFVPPVAAPKPATDENPLLRTFEWTLERDPNEACALLAATTNQWLWSGVETALDAHYRVLSATTRPSREHMMVGAVASFLEVASGRVERLDLAVERHREALDSGEQGIAALLCYPISDGYLARGDLARAAVYQQEALRMAQAGNGAAALAYAENALGMFERSVGNMDSSSRHIDAAVALVERDGAPLRVWGIRWSQAATWIERGQFDRAAEGIELCQRAAAAYGGDRFMPWLVGSEARLHERMGDLAAAREAYVRMRAIAPAGGEPVVALADEGLMRVHCGLREYDEAVQAWARVAHSRRRTGTVLSPFDRSLAAPALRTLRERLSQEEIRAAFRRATVK